MKKIYIYYVIWCKYREFEKPEMSYLLEENIEEYQKI